MAPNLTLDVMEPVRSLLDAWFLSFLQKRIFSKNEFYEMPDGSVRLTGQLRQELSEFGPVAYSMAAPWAEKVAHALEKSFKGKVILGTPLTKAKRKNGRSPYRMRIKQQDVLPKVGNRCIQCGKPALSDNRCCSECFKDREPELIADFAQAGSSRLKSLHANGNFTGHGGDAARKRMESLKAHSEAHKAWEEANPGRLEEEKERYVREIRPFLQAFTITKFASIMHCTSAYASLIKKGIQVPHPVFYADLEKAISAVKFHGDDNPSSNLGGGISR